MLVSSGDSITFASVIAVAGKVIPSPWGETHARAQVKVAPAAQRTRRTHGEERGRDAEGELP